MRIPKATFPCILALLSIHLNAATWTTGGGGNWGDAIHWSPKALEDNATFLMTVAGPTTIALQDDRMQPASFTLTNLSFESGTQVYIVEGNEKQELNFVRSSSSLPLISVAGCSEVIHSNITLNSDTTLVMTGTAPSLTFGAHSSLTSLGAVLKINPGSMNLGHLTVLSTQNGGFAAGTSVEIGEPQSSLREDAGSASITNNGGLFGVGSPYITVFKGHILNENLGVFGKMCPQITLSGNLINQTGANFGSSISNVTLNGGTLLNDIGAGTTFAANSVRINTSSSPTSFSNHGLVITEHDFIVHPGAHAILTNVTNSNSARVKTGSAGSSMNIGGNLVFHGNTFKNQNQGVVNLEGTSGSFLEIKGNLAIGPTSNLHNINTGDGVIDGGSTGSFISILSEGSAGCSFSEGTILNQNDAEVNAGAGSKILFHKDLQIHSGTLTNNNTNQGIITGSSYGSVIEVLGSVTMRGGTVISSNSGAISASPSHAGSFIHLPNGNLQLSGGSITCSNNGQVAKSIGSKLLLGGDLQLFGTGALTLNNTEDLNNQGTGCMLQARHFSMTDAESVLNLTNEGTLQGASTGVSANFNGNFLIAGGTIDLSNTSDLISGAGVSLTVQGAGNTLTISGGLVNNNSSGKLTGSSIGSQIQAPRINMLGGTLNNSGQIQTANNFTISSGTINNTHGAISVEGSLQISGSASIQNSNRGTVDGSEKAFYGADLVVQDGMLMSGGTLRSFHTDGALVAGNPNNTAAAIRVLKGAVHLSGGTIHCQSDGSVIAGTGSLFTAPDINISNSGHLILVNTSSLNSGIGCQLRVNNLHLFGGNLTLANTGNLTGNNTGCLGTVAHDLTISGGTLSLSNTGQLKGVELDIRGTLTMNGGLISTTGSQISAGAITLNAGTLESNNSLIQSQGNLTISGGFLNNSSTIRVMEGDLALSGGGLYSGGAGAQVWTSGNTILSGTGRLQLTNKLETHHLSLHNDATLTLENAAFAHVKGDFQMTGGSLFLNNGSNIRVDGAFNMSGGTFFNETVIESPQPIHISGGQFINHAHVKADAVHIHAGGTLTGSGIFDPHHTAHATINSGRLQPGNQNLFTPPPPPVLDPLTLMPLMPQPEQPASNPGNMTLHGTYTQTESGTLAINILNNNMMGHLTAEKVSLKGSLHVAALPGFSLTPGTKELRIITTGLDGVEGVFDAFTYSPEISKLGPYVFYGTDFAAIGFNYPAPTLANPLPRSKSYLGGTTYQIFFSMINRHNTGLEREMQRLRNRMHPVENQENQKNEISPPSRNIKSVTPFYAAAPSRHLSTSSNSIANSLATSPTQLAFFNWALQQKQEQLKEEVVTETPVSRPWNFYFGPTATIGDVNTKDSQLGANYWDIGGIAGFDYAFTQVGVGAAVDYGRTQVKVNKHWGKYHFNYIHSSLYATYAPKILPELAFNGIVGGGYEWYDIRRNTGIPLEKTASAHTRGSELDAFFCTEYVFTENQFSILPQRLQIIPRASLQYVYLDINKFTEHKAELAILELHSQFAKSLRSGLDLWIKYTWEWTNFSFTPEFNLGWQREYFDKDHSIHYTPAVAGGTVSAIPVFGAGRNTLTSGLDLFFEFFKRYAIEAMYDFQWNDLCHDNSFYLGFDARF